MGKAVLKIKVTFVGTRTGGRGGLGMHIQKHHRPDCTMILCIHYNTRSIWSWAGGGSGSSYWSWGERTDFIFIYKYILSSMMGQLRFNSCPILIYITFHLISCLLSTNILLAWESKRGFLRIHLIRWRGVRSTL